MKIYITIICCILFNTILGQNYKPTVNLKIGDQFFYEKEHRFNVWENDEMMVSKELIFPYELEILDINDSTYTIKFYTDNFNLIKKILYRIEIVDLTDNEIKDHNLPSQGIIFQITKQGDYKTLENIDEVKNNIINQLKYIANIVSKQSVDSSYKENVYELLNEMIKDADAINWLLSPLTEIPFNFGHEFILGEKKMNETERSFLNFNYPCDIINTITLSEEDPQILQIQERSVATDSSLQKFSNRIIQNIMESEAEMSLVEGALKINVDFKIDLKSGLDKLVKEQTLIDLVYDELSISIEELEVLRLKDTKTK